MNARFSLAVILFVPITVFASGGDGHQIICLIAEERLSPAAKTAIHELLAMGNISDAEIASWADNVRRERRQTSPWLYVDIPVEAPGFDEKRDGQKGNNVIDKSNDFARVRPPPKRTGAGMSNQELLNRPFGLTHTWRF